jgi:hypothetical protein
MPGLLQGDIRKRASNRANRANKSCEIASTLLQAMVLIGNTIQIPAFWRLPAVVTVVNSIGRLCLPKWPVADDEMKPDQSGTYSATQRSRLGGW